MHSVAEFPSFTAAADRLFTPEERDEIIDLLASNPAAGVVVPGTGGVRKLRVPASGRGKRGGARVIYYFHDEAMPVYALLVFAKNVQTDLDPEEKRIVTALVERLKSGRRTS